MARAASIARNPPVTPAVSAVVPGVLPPNAGLTCSKLFVFLLFAFRTLPPLTRMVPSQPIF